MTAISTLNDSYFPVRLKTQQGFLLPGMHPSCDHCSIGASWSPAADERMIRLHPEIFWAGEDGVR
jgi:hypothetical protein